MSDLLYRKKPVVIEAMQFQPVGSSGEDAARVESWCGGEMVVDDQGYSLVIKTLEGHMRASPGDWIIKGVKGEFYPCKPDIFEQTYESAALPAVRPDARIEQYEEAYQYALHLAEALRKNYPPNPDFRFLGDLVGLLTQIDNMVAGLSQPAVRPFDCECGQVGPCKAQFCTPRSAESHVNETPKSEHDAADTLRPATKGGAACPM